MPDETPAPQRGPGPRRNPLRQATVPPLDEDGIGAGLIGTVAFAVWGLVLWLDREALRAHGAGWWLWVAAAGVALGVLGTAYCGWRRLGRRGR